MNAPDTHQDTYSKTVFGFWLYLLTDFVLFATVLASYFVLRNSTFGGPSARDLLPLSLTLTESCLLLFSAFTAGLGNIYAHRKDKNRTVFWFSATFILGFLFTALEYQGFIHLIKQGYGWQKSAFLSAYFTLLGTHFFHMIFALLWTLVLLPPVLLSPIGSTCLQRLTCLRMFWQFLNLIWIGIFTLVYLMGVS